MFIAVMALAFLLPSCIQDTAQGTDQINAEGKGLIRKELTVDGLRNYVAGDNKVVTDSAYTVNANDRLLVFDSTNDTIDVTVPAQPPYSQTLWVHVDYTASNPVNLTGGITASFAADTTLLYYFTPADTTWRVLAR